VNQNRSERQSQNMPSTPVLNEVLRSSSESSKDLGACKDENKDDGKDENKIPVFWRVFGGTVLSMVSLIVMTAYQSLTGGIADARSEQAHLCAEMHKEFGRIGESQGDLVKEEELSSRLQMLWTSVRELQEDRKNLTALKESCKNLSTMLQTDAVQCRQMSADAQHLREQLAAREERSSLVAELTQLRERLVGLEVQKPLIRTVGGHNAE
jgi:hypothetical protein